MIAEVLASRCQRDIERCIDTFLAICDDYSDNNANPAEEHVQFALPPEFPGSPLVGSQIAGMGDRRDQPGGEKGAEWSIVPNIVVAIDLGIQRDCCTAVQNLKINLHICKNLP